MKKIAFSFFSFLALSTTSAYAEDGFAFGTSLGSAHVADRELGFVINDESLGFKVFGIYTFADNFGIEGGFINFGDPHNDFNGLPVRIDAHGWTLYGIGAIPLTGGGEVYGKAGVISWDVESTIDNVLISTDNGDNLALGIGVRADFESRLGLRFEFEWFDVSAAENVWMTSFGILIRF